MDNNCLTECTPEPCPTPREQILAMDPGARFGHAQMPGQVDRMVVVMSTKVSVLDLVALRRIAASIGYEMHLAGSAIAAPGTARSAAWFVQEEGLEDHALDGSDGAVSSAAEEVLQIAA